MKEILAVTEHRPWPLPDQPWIMSMRWHELLFAHWPVDPDVLRPWIPQALELDTFDGQAWVAVTPFRMSGVRLRLQPELLAMEFPEMNVRTYVRSRKRSGVWFFSLDAANALAVRAARNWYRLPYYDAEMQIEQRGGSVHYKSRRTDDEGGEAAFEALYRPTGEVYRAEPGDLDHWLTERYCLYALDRSGNVVYADIHHPPWSLQVAGAEIAHNSMFSQLGLDVREHPPLLHYADQLEVVAWTPQKLDEE